MKTRFLLPAWLVLLGMPAAVPACPLQEGGPTVPKWHARMSLSEQGRSQHVSYSKLTEARHTLLTADPYWRSTDAPFTGRDGTLAYFVEGELASPPHGKVRNAAAQKRRPSRAEARAAVAATTRLLAAFVIQLSVVRDALKESVPTQIERCECVGVEHCQYGWVEEDWEKLTKDAITNMNGITILMKQLIPALDKHITALFRYVPDFGKEEGKSLEEAIALLRKARSGYAGGFLANHAAVAAIIEHNCGVAIGHVSESRHDFIDGDEAWNKALDILDKLAPPPTPPGKKKKK